MLCGLGSEVSMQSQLGLLNIKAVSQLAWIKKNTKRANNYTTANSRRNTPFSQPRLLTVYIDVYSGAQWMLHRRVDRLTLEARAQVIAWQSHTELARRHRGTIGGQGSAQCAWRWRNTSLDDAKYITESGYHKYMQRSNITKSFNSLVKDT